MTVHTPRAVAAIAVVAALLFAACGGATVPTTGGSTTVGAADTTTTTRAATTTTPSSGSDLRCQNPDPTEIPLGSPIESSNADKPTTCFWVVIPAGADSATFDLSGLDADLTLGVGYGFRWTLQFNMGVYYSSREDGTADESVTVESPDAGPYFIAVSPAVPNAMSSFSLLVTTNPEMTAPATRAALAGDDECGGPATVVDFGTSVDAEVVGHQAEPAARAYFCTIVPDGLGALTFGVTGLTGDLDVLVRRPGTSDIWTDRTRGASERSVVIDNPAPGPYYVEMFSAYGDQSSEFTLSVEAG